MKKNKKIFALSLALIVVFSREEVYGMKRTLETFIEEDDSDQDEHLLLQKQMGLESFYNNTEFFERGSVRKINQADSHENDKSNADVTHQDLFDQVMDLVVSQADLNEQDAQGNTLLHHAVVAGYQDIVELLVNNSADWAITNKEGETPFDLAVNEGHHEIMRFLMDNQ